MFMGYRDKLCSIMSAQDITSSKLAKLAGLSLNGVKFILSGKKSPTISTLEKICSALNIDIQSLFNDEIQDHYRMKSDIYVMQLYFNTDDNTRAKIIKLLEKNQSHK